MEGWLLLAISIAGYAWLMALHARRGGSDWLTPKQLIMHIVVFSAMLQVGMTPWL